MWWLGKESIVKGLLAEGVGSDEVEKGEVGKGGRIMQ